MNTRLLACLAMLAALAACAVNPVTGEREIRLIGTETEIGMGEQNYLPMRQSQGGQYDIDPALTSWAPMLAPATARLP